MRKKFFSVILATLLICCFAVTLVGCNNKNKKYDVSLKIIRRRVSDVDPEYYSGEILEKIIFTPDTSELSVSFPYDGNKYRYYLFQYNISDSPELSDHWLNYDTNINGGLTYQERTFFVVGGSEQERSWLCESGQYYYQCTISEYSESVKPRTVQLNVAIV